MLVTAIIGGILQLETAMCSRDSNAHSRFTTRIDWLFACIKKKNYTMCDVHQTPLREDIPSGRNQILLLSGKREIYTLQTCYFI